MNMIFTLTLRNLLSNKKRTLLTLLTILLSISMITAILCGGWSLVDFLKEKEKVYGGDYDYYMEDLTWEQVQELYSQNNVGEVSLLRFAGNSFYGEKSNSTMLSVGEIDENFTQRFSLNQYLLAGRFPQDENELVISESFLKKNNMNTEIGDTISLTLGSRIWDEYNAQLSGLTNYRGEEESFVPTKEKAYVVVGILSDVNDSKIAANYNAFAGVDKTASDFAAYVKAKNLSNSIYNSFFVFVLAWIYKLCYKLKQENKPEQGEELIGRKCEIYTRCQEQEQAGTDYVVYIAINGVNGNYCR